jgi:hypothetical protein
MYATDSAAKAIIVPAIPNTKENPISCFSDAIDARYIEVCEEVRRYWVVGGGRRGLVGSSVAARRLMNATGYFAGNTLERS